MYRTMYDSAPDTLLQGNLGSQAFQSGLDLVCVFLGDVFFQHLRRSLHELLGLHQRQTQQALDLLDDLRLGLGVKGFQLDGENRLFLNNFLHLFLHWSSRSSRSSTGGRKCNVRDVQSGFQLGNQCRGLQQGQCGDLVNNLRDLRIHWSFLGGDSVEAHARPQVLSGESSGDWSDGLAQHRCGRIDMKSSRKFFFGLGRACVGCTGAAPPFIAGP
ncbi:hypothetical protein CLUG_05812 [Clavispora lusitaniae ATCC 42720]|uniref:Uncharacterized protein n=1 Tax=Clavispora lusitaniae (strain ATCC 42720) TaxID=306902 RepID=C4YCH3_CLAL4|nr:uncharacterized protein CLUG_05812 [Clavispora lusitaniae ATCC 42720]EEQ41684.1 hypothetical protein CLUG_05812 [Clavispora lusitaniae ATCC 42720]